MQMHHSSVVMLILQHGKADQQDQHHDTAVVNRIHWVRLVLIQADNRMLPVSVMVA